MQDDAIQIRRQVAPGLRKARRIRFQNRAHRLDRGVGLERLLPAEHLVEDEAEREDVGTVIDRMRADLLGRHVGRGAEHHAGLGLVTRDPDERGFGGSHWHRHLGQTEVEDLHASFACDEDVLRFQVAMDDALVVRGCKPACDLGRVVDRLARRQRRPVDPPAERLPFEQLGDDVGSAGVAADVVDREDVRMIEHPRRASFLLESSESIGIVGERGWEDFDRDVTREASVLRAINLAHASRTD